MSTVTISSDSNEHAKRSGATPVGTTLYYEDLAPGQIWQSPSREITLDDVREFSSLTGDFDPLHAAGDSQTASESAANSPFGKPVAHGILGLSVLAGLSTEYPRAATLALVGITDWQFENPIFFGEVVHVVTEIETVAPHGRRAGRIVWLRKLISSDGRLLQQGRFITLVASNRRSGYANPATKSTATPRHPR
ncbi:MaoC family dehydratase [Aporhodopirellula aestuarii]|uniref:Acyl dehydratase n=1 Tax=Aporhodopirellula aestuarii TaxID=2950107 RepID=A0ABT0U6A7_9BACT|nr:MaoC/PaaZ C-terminal domain-containing protein [Aporhodopirellula aestuarii]MCM2372472.1 acyl dehydratase [Aporhodopirellula aestuarii]